ncbi:MAG: acyl-[acyl-carrier-protein] thioesterase [Faecousia sp.]
MKPLYVENHLVTDIDVDCFGRMKPSTILLLTQEMASKHCYALQVDYDTLAARRMFWAVTRHRVQISRLPRHGETIRIETWPLPTTRVAYPRSVIAYDEQGQECFRAVSIWVLMDLDKRSMILPDKSGISVLGTLRGLELDIPQGLPARDLRCHSSRSVCFTDLDRNGHMNNTRCLDWVSDLLPSRFHENHTPREITVCYFNESREGQSLDLSWDMLEDGCLQVDAHRKMEEKTDRIFSVRFLY